MAGPVSIPPGMTRWKVDILRPTLAETAWVDRGSVGNRVIITEDNGSVQMRVSGTDTEVIQAFLFMRDDGGQWIPLGHVGAHGGHKQLEDGSHADTTSFFGLFPSNVPTTRELGIALRCRENMITGVRVLADDTPQPARTTWTHRSLAFESQGSAGGTTASSVSTGTITPANARRYVIGAGSILELGTPGDLTATYDGNACTGIADSGDVSISGVNWRMEMFEYAGGDSLGAGVFTLTTDNTGFFISTAAHTYSDVDQTTPSNTPSSVASGETSTPSVTVASGAGGVRVGFATGRREASDVTSGTNQNARSETNNIGAQDYWIAGDDKDAGETDNSFDWTVSGGGPYTWLAVGVELNEDTGSSGTSISATVDTTSIVEYLASINAETSFTATTDTASITEHQATVALVQDVNIPATNVALTITENASAINAEHNSTATSVSLTVAEANATATLGKNISGTSVSLTIAENASAINRAINITSGIDTVSITELSGNVARDTDIDAILNQLTITEYNSNVNRALVVTASLVQLTIDEYNAQLQVGGDVNITATTVALAVVERAASINAVVDLATAKAVARVVISGIRGPSI